VSSTSCSDLDRQRSNTLRDLPKLSENENPFESRWWDLQYLGTEAGNVDNDEHAVETDSATATPSSKPRFRTSHRDLEAGMKQDANPNHADEHNDWAELSAEKDGRAEAAEVAVGQYSTIRVRNHLLDFIRESERGSYTAERR
jgi:hypothetical protein